MPWRSLIAALAVQGAGAAMIMPMALALLNGAFPPARRGWAIGIYGSVTALAAVLGPVFGGAVTQSLGWPWIFWLNVPVALAAIPLVLGLGGRLPGRAGRWMCPACCWSPRRPWGSCGVWCAATRPPVGARRPQAHWPPERWPRWPSWPTTVPTSLLPLTVSVTFARELVEQVAHRRVVGDVDVEAAQLAVQRVLARISDGRHLAAIEIFEHQALEDVLDLRGFEMQVAGLVAVNRARMFEISHAAGEEHDGFDRDIGCASLASAGAGAAGAASGAAACWAFTWRSETAKRRIQRRPGSRRVRGDMGIRALCEDLDRVQELRRADKRKVPIARLTLCGDKRTGKDRSYPAAKNTYRRGLLTSPVEWFGRSACRDSAQVLFMPAAHAVVVRKLWPVMAHVAHLGDRLVGRPMVEFQPHVCHGNSGPVMASKSSETGRRRRHCP